MSARLVRWLLSLTLVLTFARTAHAQEMPAFTEGRHVHVVPDGWQPEFFGPHGLAEVEQAAASARFPFYVVIYQALPGAGDRDRRASATVNAIVKAWTESSAAFDPATSQVFLLSYEPRAYRFLGGSRWKNELGLTGDAWAPQLDLFKASVTSTPKDPKGGMLALIGAVDELLFKRTDPASIAAEERKAARAILSRQVVRLEGLLKEDADLLPSDLAPYRALLTKAQAAKVSDQADVMTSAAEEAKAASAALTRHVEDATDARHWTIAKIILLTLLGAALVIAFGVAAWRRQRARGRLVEEFEREADAAELKVEQAAFKCTAFETERDAVAGLKGMSGRTALVHASVTKEVDAIYLAVMAYEAHITACRELAASAGPFSLRALRLAIAKLNRPFEYDTGNAVPEKLFAGETEIITVEPATFLNDLEARYAACHGDWKALAGAAYATLTSASDHVDGIGWPALHAKAESAELPDAWLAGHPLHGGEEAVRTEVERLEALRNTDPLAFHEAIEALRDAGRKKEQLIGRLGLAMKRVSDARITRAVGNPGITLDAEDDPAVTLDRARREDHALTGLLAAVGPIEEVERKADEAAKLYRGCLAQEAAAEEATAQLEQAFTAAAEAREALTADDAKARTTIEAARKVHAKVTADGHVQRAEARRAEADRRLDQAKERRTQGRSLNAWRDAMKAAELYKEARTCLTQAIAHCRKLDEQKKAYENKLDGMASARSAAAAKARRYGRSNAVPNSYEPAGVIGPVDYAVLTAALVSEQQAWNQAAAEAQRAHEAAEAAAEASRQASSASSSSSSSYGSSWSGGGGGDSGGGYDSGGGGDSGGGW